MNKKVFPLIEERDYYCSKKFNFLKLDLERKTLLNCHAAAPHPIDFEWLKQNPGQLFNNPTSIKEREMMLRNERNSSCEQNCWHAEDVGGQSVRLSQKGNIRIDPAVYRQPGELDLTLSRDCNLACSYCCKEYSSSWARDVINNGDYLFTDQANQVTNSHNRYKGNALDKVLLNISQIERYESTHIQAVYDELDHWIGSVEIFTITGGEPMLNNQLVELMQKAKNAKKIEIFSGLGMALSRFDRVTDQLAEFNNLQLILSCENIGKFLEFNRYGIKWDEYQTKIDILKNKNINFTFHSTITNIGLFGYFEFVKWVNASLGGYNSDKHLATFCWTPRFLAPTVLDPESKEYIRSNLLIVPESYRSQIDRSINEDPTDLQRINCREFLLQFVNRRADLSLDIFPESFLKWLGIK